MADGTATRATGTPAGLRSAAVLSPGEAGELARVGLAIEKLYDEPMDIEWALAAGELSIVPARPITTPASRPAAGPGEQWNDSLAGDYPWSNGNLGEALPDVMTPATWSFVELLMSRMALPAEPARLPWLRADRRTLLRQREHFDLAGSPGRHLATPVRRTPGPGPGQAPSDRGDPASAASSMEGRPADGARDGHDDAQGPREPEADAAVPRRRTSRCERLRAEIQQTTDPTVLASLWPEKVRPLFEGACDMLSAAVLHGTTLLSSSRQAGDAGRRGRLGPAALRPAGRGRPLGQSRPGYRPRPARGARSAGTPSPASTDTAAATRWSCDARPAEDPAWIDDQLAALGDTAHDADALLGGQERPRRRLEAAGAPGPQKAAVARELIARWAPVTVTARRRDPRSRGRRG